MKIRKLILISILLLFLITTVSAAENTTQELSEIDSQIELEENNNYTVRIPDEISPSYLDAIEVDDMPLDASGNISISIDDVERYNEKVAVGGNKLILNHLNLDYSLSHDVLVNYTGDSKYLSFIKAKTMNPQIYISAPHTAYTGDTIDVEFSKDLTGNVKILIDNQTAYNQPCSKGNVYFKLDKYSYGPHSYEVIYSKENTTISEKGYFSRSQFYFEVWCENEKYQYGDSVKFTVYLPENTKGTAKFKNQTYSFKIGDSEFDEIEISGFDVGDNVVEFTANYKGKTQKIQEHVLVEPKVTMAEKLWVNGSYDFTFKASDEFNGDLILAGLINSTVKVKNGSATVPITNLKVGKSKLKATYENYTWEYKIEVLNETPYFTITANYPEVIYEWDWVYDFEEEELYHIEVLSNYDLTGTTTIIHDNKTETINGGAYKTVDPFFLEPGNHTLTVIYSNDPNFKSENRTITYEVKRYYCNITDEGYILVTLPDGEAGTLTVNVNGTKYKSQKVSVYDICEGYEIILNKASGQTYNVEVAYSGKKLSFKQTKTINKTYPFEIFTDEDYNYAYREDNIIQFILPNDVTKKATVLIDGKSYKYKKLTEDDSYWLTYGHTSSIGYEVSISNLDLGAHTVVITYPGDSKYPAKTINATFNVSSYIEEADWRNDWGVKIPLKLALPENATGIFTCEIRYAGEKEYSVFKTVALNKGKATIYLPSNMTGTYELKAYFTGNYNIKNLTQNVTVTPVIRMPYSMCYGDSKEIRVLIENTTNAKLVIFVGNDDICMPISTVNLNETDIIKINDLKDKIKAFYIENYKLSKDSTVYLKAKVYVENLTYDTSETTSVTFLADITGLKQISMYYGDTKYLNLKVYDIYGRLVGANQAVKITIAKYTFSAKTDKNGAVKFKIPTKVTPGTFKVTVSYKNAKITSKITVKKVLTLKTAKVKKSAKKLVLTATLKKGKTAIKGKVVTFKFAGKTYKAKTNKKGIAKATIKKSVLKKLKVGKKVAYQVTYIKNTVKKTAKVLK